jgi:hypothetical protein
MLPRSKNLVAAIRWQMSVFLEGFIMAIITLLRTLSIASIITAASIYNCTALAADIGTPQKVTIKGARGLKSCLQNADTIAKKTAELQSQVVRDKFQQTTIVAGASSGVGCVLVSVLMLGSDFGMGTAACAAIGAGIAAGTHAAGTEENAKEAKRVFEEALRIAQLDEIKKCTDQYE